jgi:hypothetical protein
LIADANPIGVIFYLGKHDTDTTTYTQKDGVTALGEFHGYVVAAWDATYNPVSGNNDGVEWGIYDSWADPTPGVSSKTSDFLGYANSLAIKAAANGTLSDNADTNYPAFYYAMDLYEMNIAAPATSSGWFLPSIYQIQYIWDTFNPESATDALIDNKLAALAELGLGAKMYVTDSEYWSSTERVSSGSSYQSMYFNFDYSSFNPGFSSYSNKYDELRVRAMLAF